MRTILALAVVGLAGAASLLLGEPVGSAALAAGIALALALVLARAPEPSAPAARRFPPSVRPHLRVVR